MITHEIQPNLTLFEPSQITSSVFFSASLLQQSSLAALCYPHLQGFGEKLGAASLPQVASFQVSLFERGTERGPRGLALDSRHLPSTDERLVGTDRNTESQRLIKTYTLRFLQGMGTESIRFPEF